MLLTLWRQTLSGLLQSRKHLPSGLPNGLTKISMVLLCYRKTMISAPRTYFIPLEIISRRPAAWVTAWDNSRGDRSCPRGFLTGFIGAKRLFLIAFFVVFAVLSAPVASARAASLLTKSSVRLVSPAGGPKIYAMVGGHKYLFRSPSSLSSYTYQYSKVEVAESASLEKTPFVRLIKSSLG